MFENFRNICLKQYKLDPANYYTSPGLSWDALLKKTNVELELLTDYNMYPMVEKGLRGGISMFLIDMLKLTTLCLKTLIQMKKLAT